MKRPKATLDDVIRRIVGHIRRNGKIIAVGCEGALVDELMPVLNRLNIRCKGCSRAEIILAAIDTAVRTGELERFDDGIDLVIALPNEWPPADLVGFFTISDADFEPLVSPSLFRHVRGSKAWRELSQY